MAQEITHRVAYFDTKGQPMKLVNYSGELPAVTAAAIKHAPKSAQRIHVTNDVEGSRKKGQLVRNLSRDKHGTFQSRYNPEPINAYDKTGRAIQGNPTHRGVKVSKTAIAALRQTNASMLAATQRLGR